MNFAIMANNFISEVVNLKSVTTMNAGVITGNSVTIHNIVLSKEEFNYELAPLLRKYTNDDTTAQMIRFRKTEERQTLGQTYYYDVQLTMNKKDD